MSNLIGYARVSTSNQDTDFQAAALKAAGCSIIRKEKVSGRSRDGRTELQTILDFIRPGDTLVVTKLDRLGRSTRDVLNLVHELTEKGAALKVLEPSINTADATGKIVLTVLGMVAEMEHTFIKERQRAGIEAAKVRGVYKGRPATLDHGQIIALRNAGKGPTEIAKALGCSRGAIYKVLASSR
jgi:DNA invertase Pin-like site-specific DNA recombinase